MFEDILGGPPPMIREADVAVLPPAGQVRVPEQPPAPPDAEHIRAVDALFSRDDESSIAAGLIGLSLGAAPLIDMMAEQFREPDDEEAVPQKKTPPSAKPPS
jgi:hypothetical protein